MAALEDGSQATGGPRGGVKSAPQKRYPTHMKKEDIEIQERLERLKESHKVGKSRNHPSRRYYSDFNIKTYSYRLSFR